MNAKIKEIEVNFYSYIKIEIIIHFYNYTTQEQILNKNETFNLFQKLHKQKINNDKLNIKSSSKYSKDCIILYELFTTGKNPHYLPDKFKGNKDMMNNLKFYSEDSFYGSNKSNISYENNSPIFDMELYDNTNDWNNLKQWNEPNQTSNSDFLNQNSDLKNQNLNQRWDDSDFEDIEFDDNDFEDINLNQNSDSINQNSNSLNQNRDWIKQESHFWNNKSKNDLDKLTFDYDSDGIC